MNGTIARSRLLLIALVVALALAQVACVTTVGVGMYAPPVGGGWYSPYGGGGIGAGRPVW